MALACLAGVAWAAPGEFDWVAPMGGTGDDRARGVATDTAGNAYVTGHFLDTVDFDPGPGVLNLTSAGGQDIFVAKYDVSGALLWARRFGGVMEDVGYAIAVDSSGNVHVTGYFEDTVDFDPGPSMFNLSSAGSRDIFVLKLDGSGNLVWVARMGGSGVDEASALALGPGGTVHTTGTFESAVDFDPGAGVATLASAGGRDSFISKLDAGGAYVWAGAIGSSSNDFARGMTVDGAGNVYTVGGYMGTADFDPGPGVFNLVSSGSRDAYVSKLDAAGNLVWAVTTSGAAGEDEDGYGVAVDAAGGVYVAGSFTNTADFDPGPGVLNLTSAGQFDGFLWKLTSGGALVWAHSFGSTIFDGLLAIAIDGAGNVHATGGFRLASDFDPGAGTFTLTSAGENDVPVLVLDGAAGFVRAVRFGGTSNDFAYGIAVGPGDSEYLAGFFAGTSNFDPGPGVEERTAVGSLDAFVVRLGPTPTAVPSATGWGRVLLALCLLGALTLALWRRATPTPKGPKEVPAE